MDAGADGDLGFTPSPNAVLSSKISILAIHIVLMKMTYDTVFFLNIFIAPTVYTTHGREGFKIVPLTNLNEHLHNDSSGTGVDLYVSENTAVKTNYATKNTETSGL
jgi:hypothetical protein